MMERWKLRSALVFFCITFGIILSILAVPSLPTHAQKPDNRIPVEPIRVPLEARTSVIERLALDDSMAPHHIRAITQDHDGFIWFGTRGNGLYRYDGYTFQNFTHNPTEPGSFCGPVVEDIVVARDGSLWIAASEAGLAHMNPATQMFDCYHYAPETPGALSDQVVMSVFEGSQGQIWAGTLHGHLNRYDPVTDTFHTIVLPSNQSDKMVHNPVHAFVEDRTGHIWVNAGGTIARYDSEQDTFTIVFEDLGAIRTFAADPQGGLWAGGKMGLYHLDPPSGNVSITHTRQQFHVQSLLVARDGTLWIGTPNQGLFSYDPQRDRIRRHYQHQQSDMHSLSNNNITGLYQDAEGIIWIGLLDQGLNLLDQRRQQFITYPPAPPVPLPTPQSDGGIEDTYPWASVVAAIQAIRSGLFQATRSRNLT
jgi:ligand-binding sensor domain-containing protein